MLLNGRKKLMEQDNHTDLTEVYDSAYFAERDELPAHLLNALDILLTKRNCMSILEVGSGSGRLMKALQEKGYKVEGVDVSPVAAQLSGSRVGTATHLPFKDNSVDCILGISIIEHLDSGDGNKFLSESWRVLKKGGTLFLVTPNLASPVKLAQGKKWFGYTDKTHIFFYSPSSLKKALEHHNYKKMRRTFKVHTSAMDWPFPLFIKGLPEPFRILINNALINSPLALLRDSFWISGEK